MTENGKEWKKVEKSEKRAKEKIRGMIKKGEKMEEKNILLLCQERAFPGMVFFCLLERIDTP